MGNEGIKFLCYVLLSACHNYYWSGDGFRRFTSEGMPLGTMPRFDCLRDAQDECKRLKRTMNLTAKPVRVRLA